MSRHATLILFILTFGFASCASESDSGRSPSPDPTVTVSLPERPATVFSGNVGIEVTTLPRSGTVGEQALIEMQSSSRELSESAGLRLLISLEDLGNAINGQVVVVPAPTDGLQDHGTYTGPQTDGRTPESHVGSFSLSLDGTTMTLTATTASGSTVTALGQFGVICTSADTNGDAVTDALWSSDFCSTTRDTLGLAPWIAVAK